MNTFIDKLLSLSYDFIGILLPGLTATVFILFILIGLDLTVPGFILSGEEDFGVDTVTRLFQDEEGSMQYAPLAIALLIWYLAGQFLKGLSRNVHRDDDLARKVVPRTWYFLTFRVLAPETDFHRRLAPLFVAVRNRFETEGVSLNWQQFFPIARSHLSQNLTKSLIETYQNKYTLHRSIAIVGVLSFWMTVIALLISVIAILMPYDVNSRTAASSQDSTEVTATGVAANDTAATEETRSLAPQQSTATPAAPAELDTTQAATVLQPDTLSTALTDTSDTTEADRALPDTASAQAPSSGPLIAAEQRPPGSLSEKKRQGWWLLTTTLLVSLITVSSFSASFRYNWLLFGDTIITEMYAHLFQPDTPSDG